MFNLSSNKSQRRANSEMRRRWRLFHATDFESLMYPSFTFCYILGIFPYKINASVLEISKPYYIFSTVITSVCFISLLTIFSMLHIFESIQYKSVPRSLERHCFYMLSGFIVAVTYILSGPRMRLLQTLMEISSELPPKLYQKLSRLIHAKDILGSLYILMEMSIYFRIDVHIVVKIFITYSGMLIFQMDMMYMNCVCVLKACFERIDDNLESMRKLMMNNEAYHIDQMYYKQRNLFLLIKLKALKKKHMMISNTIQMLNITFSLQLLTTIIITFVQITFKCYFCILYYKTGESMIKIDDHLYTIYLITSIIYYFIKIMLIVWACETGENQSLQIGTTVHQVLNSANNEIKSELQLFSLQILHHKNKFSTKSLNVDARLLTAMMGSITTYLMILIQFLNITHICRETTSK